MALTITDIKNLVAVAQGNNQEQSEMALTDIIIEVMNEHMDRHLARYTHKNTVGGMDADDMRQIFLIGCSKAVMETNPHIGNPLMFILQKGKWAVVSELRSLYRQNIRQYCHKCKKETRIHEKHGVMICPSCHTSGSHVERIQVNNLDDGTVTTGVRDEKLSIDDTIANDLLVDKFRSRLGGRKADVFDLIFYEGYDRDSCRNYIREVADVLGVTPANVNLRLRQIKGEWLSYMTECASGSEE